MESASKSQLNRNQINQITKKVFGSHLSSYKELTDGWFNAAYALITASGDSAVLKVAPTDSKTVLNYEKNIMDVEVAVLQLLEKEVDIPIPKLYYKDFGETFNDKNFFLMEKLEGVPYNYVKDKMDKEVIESIEQKLGIYQKRINSVKNDCFGLLSEESPKYDDWYSCYYAMMENLINDGKRHNLDLGVDPDEILSTVQSLKYALDTVTEPQLVHWDLWEGNLFVHEGEITGIIDFERALWGDPLMEIFFTNDQNEAFIEGYGRCVIEEPYYDIRRLLYGVYMGVVMVTECPYRNYTDPSHIAWAKGQLQERYSKLMNCIN